MASIEASIQIAGDEWLHLTDPIRVCEASRAEDVVPVLRKVEDATRSEGLFAAGFLSFEAAAAFSLAVSEPRRGDPPLVWFALFAPERVHRSATLGNESESYRLGTLDPSVSPAEFAAAIARIKRYLADGDTYQVNYTFRLGASFDGSARSLFADLVAAQGCRFGAYLRTDRWSICSASPELFLQRTGELVIAQPMKGTAARGRFSDEDDRLKRDLASSPKERAENVMIVDMVRNDLGRIADVGSVDVPELFTLERYPNVWQMTSQVRARSAAGLVELLAATFPSASVTGAPKIRTMELLSGLETTPRGVYTGAVGCIRPGGDLTFNVAIRTAVVDHSCNHLVFGTGSGVVWDSASDREYDECLLKSSVLGHRPPRFELLETMRWTPTEGIYLLDRHFRRLQAAADYFGYKFDDARIRRAVDEAVVGWRVDGAKAIRMRLLLDRDGVVRIDAAPLTSVEPRAKVRIASSPIDTNTPFVFHKTTHREMYDRFRSADADEVILWNDRGEITEGITTNVVADVDGARVTPPVSCGLLAGTFRAELVAGGEVVEKILTVEMLQTARQVWIVNSVRGWREAEIDWAVVSDK